MINFYLGAPGVFHDLPVILAEAEGSRPDDRYIQTQQSIETRVRPYLNARSREPAELERLRNEAHAAADAIPRDAPVVVSQPELFGTPPELMRAGKTFPMIERRFARLCEIFADRAWTAHLVITCQTDAIWQLDGVAPQRKLQAICETGLSWSNLVWRLRRVARECDLIVWDFERPEVVAPTFVESLLQVGRGKLGRAIYERIAKGCRKPNVEFLRSCSADEVSAVERLDDIYDTELEKIATMKGVTLVRA